jgi:hypothetical protein
MKYLEERSMKTPTLTPVAPSAPDGKAADTSAPVSAMTYWQRHGIKHCEQLAIACGTSYDYWKQIANLRKRPSIELARRLVALSQGEMSLELLLTPKHHMRQSGAAPMPDGNKVGVAQHRRKSRPPPSPDELH